MLHFKQLLLLGIFAMPITISAQIGIGTSSPDASAALDVSSTSQGLLIPRMTTAQISNISNPANGLLVFNTSIMALQMYTSAISGETISQTSGSSSIYLYGAYEKGQSFTTTSGPYSIFYVKFNVVTVNTPGTVTVQLRNTSPSGTLLGSKTISVSNSGWNTATIVTSSTCPAGTYSFNLAAGTADLTLNDVANTYAGGQLYSRYGSTASWTANSGADLQFIVETPGQSSGWQILAIQQ